MTTAEYERMVAQLADGPVRRMAQDKAAGRGPSRADMEHAARLRGWMGATKKARSDS